MDLLKIALNIGPVRDFVAKQLNKVIYLKTGYHADVLLNDLVVKNEGGKVVLHLNSDVTMSSEEFYDILNKLSQ